MNNNDQGTIRIASNAQKWMNCQLENPTIVEALREYLKSHDIEYELSSAFHFEILATPFQASSINYFLNEVKS